MYYLLVRIAISLLIVLLAWGWTRWRYRTAAHWPATEGAIEQVRLIQVNERSPGQGPALKITYSYSVDGNFYGGHQQFGFQEGAPYSYLLGRKIEVRYKPQRPDTSWLLTIPPESQNAAPFPNPPGAPLKRLGMYLIWLVAILVIYVILRPSSSTRVPSNYSPAFARYVNAAQVGAASGQFDLGLMYEDGRGVPKDDTQAAAWYRKAAEQGHAAAENNLGAMYQNGRGVPKDDALAAHWYRKAAIQGYASAQFNLGAMYENGRGVAKDQAEAISWYRGAANRGSPGAKDALRRLGIRP